MIMMILMKSASISIMIIIVVSVDHHAIVVITGGSDDMALMGPLSSSGLCQAIMKCEQRNRKGKERKEESGIKGQQKNR
jgi:hypothetical protein